MRFGFPLLSLLIVSTACSNRAPEPTGISDGGRVATPRDNAVDTAAHLIARGVPAE